MRSRLAVLLSLLLVAGVLVTVPAEAARAYPLHTRIVATSFWVGEIFNPNASDGSQMISTYDDQWYQHFGGCDGVNKGTGTKKCQTEKRTAANGFFPSAMTPLENPFYLDLPYDDLNDRVGFRDRGKNIPWANDPGYAGQASNKRFSMMKNRWVQITRGGNVCYGQVEDAGPADGDNGGRYDDAAYVFGSGGARPLNRAFGAAGMDVSPALTGCLALPSLDGISPADISWRWIEASDVPAGPWTRVVTTSQVNGAKGSAEYEASIRPGGSGPAPTTPPSSTVPPTPTTTAPTTTQPSCG